MYMGYDKGLNRNHSVAMILAVLGDGARHGYDIAREVERRSAQRINFKDGTLYPILRSLEADGLIASTWEGGEGERQRRVYTVTDHGMAELERQKSVWDEYTHAVNSVLRGESGTSDWSRVKAWIFGR